MRERSPAGYVRTLLSLEQEGFTGALQVRAEGVTTLVHFRRGTIVFAEGGTASDSLGRLLVQEGAIDQEAYAEAIRVMTEALVDDEMMRLGEVLVQLGHMTLEEVRRALEAQVRRKVMRSLRWDQLALSLDRTGKDTPAGDFPMKVEPNLLAAAARYVNSERAAEMLQPWRGFYVALRQPPEEISRGLALSAMQRRALERIDGRHETWDLVARMGADGLDPVPLVVALFLADHLEPLRRPRAAAPAAQAPAPQHPRRQAPATQTTDRAPTMQARTPQPPATPSASTARETAHRASVLRGASPTARRTQPQPTHAMRDHPRRHRRPVTRPGRITTELLPHSARTARRERPTWRTEDLPRRQAGTHRTLEPDETTETPPAITQTVPPDSAKGRRRRLEAEQAYHRGLRHLWAQRFKQARDTLAQASRLDPDNLEYELCALWARYRCVESPSELLSLQPALDSLATQVAAQDRSLPFPPYVLAHLALLEHEEARALRLFRVAAHRDPDNIDAEGHVRLLSKRLGRD